MMIDSHDIYACAPCLALCLMPITPLMIIDYYFDDALLIDDACVSPLPVRLQRVCAQMRAGALYSCFLPLQRLAAGEEGSVTAMAGR